MPGGKVVEHQHRGRTEQDVRCPAWFGGGEPTGEVPAGDLLVHRIGLDMLIEEQRRIPAEPQAA
jgi:hypothetical protein